MAAAARAERNRVRWMRAVLAVVMAIGLALPVFLVHLPGSAEQRPTTASRP